jgi:hypothetical protein
MTGTVWPSGFFLCGKKGQKVSYVYSLERVTVLESRFSSLILNTSKARA